MASETRRVAVTHKVGVGEGLVTQSGEYQGNDVSYDFH